MNLPHLHEKDTSFAVVSRTPLEKIEAYKRIIGLVERYEEEMGYAKHPVGMTMQYSLADQSKVKEVLSDDWISPGFDDVQSPMQESQGPWSLPVVPGCDLLYGDPIPEEGLPRGLAPGEPRPGGGVPRKGQGLPRDRALPQGP